MSTKSQYVPQHVVNKFNNDPDFVQKECLFCLSVQQKVAEDIALGGETDPLDEFACNLHNELLFSLAGEGDHGAPSCELIHSIFEGCSNCPHFGKVSSPAFIRNDNFIPTLETGFHHIVYHATKLNHDGTKCAIKYIPIPEHLVQFYNQLNRHVSTETGEVYVYKDDYWQACTENELHSFAQENYSKPYEFGSTTAHDRSEFLKTMQTTNKIKRHWFVESTEGYFNFKNGVLNIKTGEMQANSPEFGFRTKLPWSYDPSATCELFEKTLNKIMLNRTDLVKAWLETTGYLLMNDNQWAQQAIFWTGDGSNGKSTLLRVLEKLVGKGNYSSQEIQHMKGELNVAVLENKHFNVSSEATPDALQKSDYFKKITAGDKITGRWQYGTQFEFECRCKQLIICNELPKSGDKSKGFNRRFYIIPFDAEFKKTDPDYDPDIEEKLFQELPGIFNLILTQYKKAKKRKKFLVPEAVKIAQLQYMEENDNVVHFINEYCTFVAGTGYGSVGGEIYHSKKKVYRLYKEFVQEINSVAANDVNFWKRFKRAAKETGNQLLEKKSHKYGRQVGEFIITHSSVF